LPPLTKDDLRATQGIDKDIQTRQLPALQLTPTSGSTPSSPAPHTAGLAATDNLPLNPSSTSTIGYTVDFSNTGKVTFITGGGDCGSSCVNVSGASGEIIGTAVEWEPKDDEPDVCTRKGCIGYLSLYKEGCSLRCWYGQTATGYFDIKGILDGNYTLNIENGDGDEVSRLITITGGNTVDLGTIETNTDCTKKKS
jgi:hypothetical protein